MYRASDAAGRPPPEPSLLFLRCIVRKMNSTMLKGGELHCACILFFLCYVWEEEKSKLECLLNGVGQFDPSLSDAPRQPLPLHYCLIRNESSVQTESDEVCQSSLFRVKFIFSSLFSVSHFVSLPPFTCFFL